MKTILLIMILSIAFFSESVNAQTKYDMPLSGVSNKGTEFLITFHPFWEETPSNYIKLYIFSDQDTKVKVSVEGKNFSEEQEIKAYEQSEFNIPKDVALMYSKDDSEKPQPAQVWKGRAIHVEAEDPIICYGIVREEYTSDGFLSIPVSTLGNRYVVSSYSSVGHNTSQYLTSYTSVIGAYDNTVVTFTLGGNSNTTVEVKNGASLSPGESVTKVLQKGDVWLIPAIGDNSDLSGSYIEADKPVSVISGQFCTYVPNEYPACDFLIEQELPIESWSKSYNVPIVEKRVNAPVIRIFASEPNTDIYRNGEKIASIDGPGGIENQGFVSMRLWDINMAVNNKPARLTSDKPFAVTFYNQGQSEDSVESDPFQMSIISEKQYSNMYVFSTPGYSGEGFKTNNLIVIYKSEHGDIPDDVIFGEKTIDGFKNTPLNQVVTSSPQPFGDGSGYFMVTVDLEKDNIYGILGAEPLMVYLYGGGEWDSYGYPAGALFKDLENDDDDSPIVKYISEDGADYTGDVTDQGISGMAYVGILSEFSNNYKLTTQNYINGDSVVHYELNVIDKAQNADAVIYGIDKAGNQVTQSFAYNANTSVNEPVQVGTVSIQEVYPSPAADELSLKISSEIVYTSASITISDVAGKSVKVLNNIVITSGQTIVDINVGDLAGGVYYVKMHFDDYVLTEKFVKR